MFFHQSDQFVTDFCIAITKNCTVITKKCTVREEPGNEVVLSHILSDIYNIPELYINSH